MSAARSSEPRADPIEEWVSSHPRWGELAEAVAELGQEAWIAATAPFHRSAHVLVAVRGGVVAGFLRFVVQEIGPELDRPPLAFAGQPLIEAKILAFGVLPAFRRQGIGLALQRAAIARGRALGCHQVRSHSGGTNGANHRLKLSLGFGVHPIVRGDDTGGVYFILPLGERTD